MKNKIIKILMENLSPAYCYNCEHEGNGGGGICDECNRKSIMWSLSKDRANKIADRILEEQESETNN